MTPKQRWGYVNFWGNLHGVNPISDDSTVYLYENQRWNPVHGFSSRGLPTDRSSWSDATGCIPNTKEQLSLTNRHWTWVLNLSTSQFNIIHSQNSLELYLSRKECYFEKKRSLTTLFRSVLDGLVRMYFIKC